MNVKLVYFCFPGLRFRRASEGFAFFSCVIAKEIGMGIMAEDILDVLVIQNAKIQNISPLVRHRLYIHRLLI